MKLTLPVVLAVLMTFGAVMLFEAFGPTWWLIAGSVLAVIVGLILLAGHAVSVDMSDMYR